MTDPDQVRTVIKEYVDACKVGSVDRLKAIFHPHALMSGFMTGNYMMGTPDPFYDAVANAPAGSGADYRAEIISVEISGPVASAILKEKGFMGMNFTDYFHLVKIDGNWKIISKTFNQEQD